ncbi:hypothetical protein BJX68DRAFT_259714 [Aspergillus pseudodeflectus]|uniref:Tubby C-terminal-like domain-containing protein n=1 Tax=Aspergillus pseudodeflectus TaxID=176178 RepID=A0ABR4JAE3_9EURO
MPSQTITIKYTPEKRLSLLDAITKRPLYHVKVSRQVPQMEMIRLAGSQEGGNNNHAIPADEETYFESRVCTAQFKMTSLDRKSILSTSYSFVSPALSAGDALSPTILTWETDSENNAVGNFRLVVERQMESERKVLVLFRNETFSNELVGTFDIVDGGLDQLVKDEAVISGLAMLAMNQSFNLAERLRAIIAHRLRGVLVPTVRC